MLKKYCKTCGQATEYSSKLPTFCSECGVSFSGAPTKRAVKAKVEVEVEDDQSPDPDTDSFRAPISSLAYDVDRLEKPSTTIGALAALGPQKDTPQQLGRGPVGNVDEKQFLRDFRQEAGSLKDQRDGGT